MNTISNINFDIITIIHRLFIEGKRKKGGLDKVLEYFINQKNLKILLIEHPLFNQGRSYVSLLSPGKSQSILKQNTRHKIKWLSWLKEIRFNLKITKASPKKKIFFASDPLCALPGILRCTKFSQRYYHSIDYSEHRFQNAFLNSLYHWLIKLIITQFDLIGVVSLKTKKRFLKKHCPSWKLFFIPNSPFFKKIDLTQKKNNSIICMGGGIIPKFRYEDILQIAQILQKTIPDIKFYIAGGIQDKNYFRKIKLHIKKLSLEENFVFTGFLSPERLELLLKKTKILISFYSQEVEFYTQYGDSLKVRECALYGIPTIADGRTATDQEMKKNGAGFIVKNNQQAAEKIEYLLLHPEIYQQNSRNAILWAQKNDKKKMLEKLYQRIFSQI